MSDRVLDTAISFGIGISEAMTFRTTAGHILDNNARGTSPITGCYVVRADAQILSQAFSCIGVLSLLLVDVGQDLDTAHSLIV